MEGSTNMNGNTDVLSAQPAFPPKPDFDRTFEDANLAAAASNSVISAPATSAEVHHERVDAPSSFTDSAPALTAPSDFTSSAPSSSAIEQPTSFIAEPKLNINPEGPNGISLASEVSTRTPPPEESLKPSIGTASPQISLPLASAPPRSPTPDQSRSQRDAPNDQNTLPPASLDISAPIPAPVEQPPTSNLRSSPHPENLDAGGMEQIQNDKHQQDLANDNDLAQGLASESQAPIERRVTPPPEPIGDNPVVPDSMEVSDAVEPSPSEPAPAPVSAPVPTSSSMEPPVSIPATAGAASPIPDTVISASNSQHIPPPPIPAETRELPASVPAPLVAHSGSEEDQSMIDAPPSTTKVAHDREEDGEAEPAAKRPKTESVDQAEFKVPEPPKTAGQEVTENGVPSESQATFDDADKMTDARYTFLKRQVQSLKKLKAASWFLKPVDYVALKIPEYPNIIKRPIALSDIEEKLKRREYTFVTELKQDLELLVTNARTFNGPEHQATKDGTSLMSSFEHYMVGLPPPTIPEPSKQEKKAQKSKEQPTRSVPVRKQSIASQATASSPTGTAADRFALAPGGVPTIRRDSTAVGDRPKRAIKPSKAKLDIGGARPRKKKFETQLRFCKHVLDTLKKNKYWSTSQYFLEPVDPVALNIPNYHNVIKKPMDMHTMEDKLNDNQYEKAKEFEEDFRLIFKNCYKFNVENDVVWTAGKQFEQTFDDIWGTKDAWIEQHEPVSGPQTPSDDSDAAGSEEDPEDEAVDSEAERQQQLQLLQRQIQLMSEQMGELTQARKKKKKPSPPVPPKKGSKSSKLSRKDSKSSGFPGLATVKSTKKAAKPKAEKERMVTYNEKQYISTGISSLNDGQMMDALRIIQTNVPRLKDVDESEIELDIDELPNGVLLKLLNFLKKHIPQAPPEPPAEPTYLPKTSSAAPSKPKKNKPMSKHEQEARIAELTGKLNTYGEGNGNHGSPDPIQSVEHGGASSGDEDDSEESEEE